MQSERSDHARPLHRLLLLEDTHMQAKWLAGTSMSGRNSPYPASNLAEAWSYFGWFDYVSDNSVMVRLKNNLTRSSSAMACQLIISESLGVLHIPCPIDFRVWA